MNRTHKGLQRH